MVEDAERRGVLKPGGTIVEPTSGNTGIGLAMVAAVKGYRLILTMPEDMSVERQRLFARFGAEIHLTPAIEGMTGAVFAAEELLREHPEYFMPQQFQNPANPEVHRRTTALEILDAVDGTARRVRGGRRHRRARSPASARSSRTRCPACASSRWSRRSRRCSPAAAPARTASRASAPPSCPACSTASVIDRDRHGARRGRDRAGRAG